MECAPCAKCLDSVYTTFLSSVEDVDWTEKARDVGIVLLITLIITFISQKIPVSYYCWFDEVWEPVGRFSDYLGLKIETWLSQASRPFKIWQRNPPSQNNKLPRAQYVCGGDGRGRHPFNSKVRTLFSDTEASIYSWPSRGGVIILEKADAIDLEFLDLDPLDPPDERLQDQKAEDAFSQRLLLLGAKWWDSEARYMIVLAMRKGRKRIFDSFKIADQPPPTVREDRFVKVGWPSTGGLWVSEHEIGWEGDDEDDDCMPTPLARLDMTRTMDERCDMLRRHFKATFFETLKHCPGDTFLNSWEQENIGEVGLRLQPEETIAFWKQGYTVGGGPVQFGYSYKAT